MSDRGQKHSGQKPDRNPSERRRPKRRNPLDWPSTYDWQEKFSDASNPMLVRDLQQSLNGNAVARSSAIASLAILILLIIFIKTSGETRNWGAEGDAMASLARDSFAHVWICLIPILWFILPMRAFLSMRVEARGSAAEHLALCDLSPWRILTGKMLTGVTLSWLYLGICTPMLALATALRGVDPTTFAITLYFAVLIEAMLISGALAAAMLTRYEGLRNGVLALMAITLGATTLVTVTSSDQLILVIEAATRASVTATLFWSGFIAAFWITTTSLVAISALAHSYENRATALRCVGLIGPVIAAAVIALGPTSLSSHALAPSPFILLAVNLPFWFVAISEESSLSTRVAMKLPKNPLLRLLLVPFLPGRGRGLIYAVLCISSITLLCWSQLQRTEVVSMILWALYLLLLATITPLLRAHCEAKNPRSANWRSRGLALILIVTGCFVGLAYNAGRGAALGEWNSAQFLNPFAAINAAQIHGLSTAHLLTLVVLSVGAGAVSFPLIKRSIREAMTPISAMDGLYDEDFPDEETRDRTLRSESISSADLRSAELRNQDLGEEPHREGGER